MSKKIIFVSDFNLKGSGYLNISVPICEKLSQLGYEIKAVGLGYAGEEHPFHFSIIPCNSYQDAHVVTNNLRFLWQADLIIVALDIPHLEEYVKLCTKININMIAITPLENPPLTPTWAYLLQQIPKVFFISQLGDDEAKKVGLDNTEHLVIGMDTEAWRMRTQEEYTKGREALNISPETMVVLTVADNQERKNLSKAMEIISKLKHEKKVKVRYILVTRENASVGWKLRDLAMTYRISSDVMIFERGLSFKALYSLYAISDAYLLTSKAEGLCMPVLEAMSVGVPVVATSCGTMQELLADGRGFLMETEYQHIDPWGNSRRDFPFARSGVDFLEEIFQSHGLLTAPDKSRIYMESRTWDKPIQQIVEAMEKINEAK